MSKFAEVLECQNGYTISWNDDFKLLQNTEPTDQIQDSPQILESGHFIMWDFNWKFKLTFELNPGYGFIRVSVFLEVLDVKSWDEKGLSISASLKACYRTVYESPGITVSKPEERDYSSKRLEDYKINYVHEFSFSKINERILHVFDFTWTILQEDSARFERHVSNAKRIKLMVNKWGLMLEDTVSHDVKIQCQGVEMSAHKVILSGTSSVFKAMFQAGMKESRDSVVEVTVGSPEAVKVMLRWIYGCTGDIEGKESHALDLLKLAHYYDLTELMEECQLILVNKLCKENVIEMLNEADLLGAKKLKDSAIQFIIRNKSELKDDFEKELKPKLIVEILMAH